MACNCNSTNYKCPGSKTSSNCVTWMGPSFPDLGVCTGDEITFVVETILNRLVELLNETEAPLNVNLDTCQTMKVALAGRDKTVDNLLQILIDNQCTLEELIEAVDDKIPGPSESYAFQLKCITPAGASTNVNAIIQGIIDKVCALETQVAQIAPNTETVVNNSMGVYLKAALKGQGDRGIVQGGTSPNFTFTFTAFVPPFCPIPYVGPLSNFDSSGKGLAGTAFEGWYLLNGNNGMFDARGRTLVAAVASIPGPALDSSVDPSNANNPNTNYSLGDKFGSSYERLTVQQIPSHTHSVIDPGHSHDYDYPSAEKFSGSKFNAANAANINLRPTETVQTGISIGATGGGDLHNNRQPSFVVTGYIMRIN